MKTRYNRLNLAVAKAAAKEGSADMTAVDLTPEYTIASNSFILAKVTTPKTDSTFDSVLKPVRSPGSLLIGRDVVLGIKLPKFNKDSPGTDAVYLTEVGEDRVTLTTYDLETGSKKNTEAVKGSKTRPMFEGFLEEAHGEKGVTIEVNVDYMIELLKIAKGLSPHVMIHVPIAKGKAITFKNKGGEKQEFEGLLMPLNRHE